MNHKLLKASLAGVAAIAVTAGGGTLAAFSDFRDIEDNAVGAGILRMSLTPNAANPGDTTTFDNIELAPGQYYERQAYVATNDADSTPAAKLFLDVSNLVGDENGCDTNSETAQDADCASSSSTGDLIDQATLTVNSSLPSSTGSCSVLSASSQQVLPTRTWKLSDLVGGTFPMSWLTTAPGELELTGEYQDLVAPVDPGMHAGVVNKKNLAPGEGICVLMTVALPNLPTNDLAQGDDLSFDLRFVVKQDTFTYGSDSDYFVS